VTLPNGDRAVIAAEKLRDYLLNLAHRKGGPKAKLLTAMGYRPDEWQRLEADIRAAHVGAAVDRVSDNDYGSRYEVVALLTGPAE